jgi:hypothetical protein
MAPIRLRGTAGLAKEGSVVEFSTARLSMGPLVVRHVHMVNFLDHQNFHGRACNRDILYAAEEFAEEIKLQLYP